MLAKTRGSTTINLYTRHFSKWRQWVSPLPNTHVIPADNTYVTVYMLNLFKKNKSFEVIRISFFAMNYFQEVTGYKNALTRGLLYLVLEGIKRTSLKISRKKLPATTLALAYAIQNFRRKKHKLERFSDDFDMYFFCLFMGFLRLL